MIIQFVNIPFVLEYDIHILIRPSKIKSLFLVNTKMKEKNRVGRLEIIILLNNKSEFRYHNTVVWNYIGCQTQTLTKNI